MPEVPAKEIIDIINKSQSPRETGAPTRIRNILSTDLIWWETFIRCLQDLGLEIRKIK